MSYPNVLSDLRLFVSMPTVTSLIPRRAHERANLLPISVAKFSCWTRLFWAIWNRIYDRFLLLSFEASELFSERLDKKIGWREMIHRNSIFILIPNMAGFGWKKNNFVHFNLSILSTVNRFLKIMQFWPLFYFFYKTIFYHFIRVNYFFDSWTKPPSFYFFWFELDLVARRVWISMKFTLKSCKLP